MNVRRLITNAVPICGRDARALAMSVSSSRPSHTRSRGRSAVALRPDARNRCVNPGMGEIGRRLSPPTKASWLSGFDRRDVPRAPTRSSSAKPAYNVRSEGQDGRDGDARLPGWQLLCSGEQLPSGQFHAVLRYKAPPDGQVRMLFLDPNRYSSTKDALERAKEVGARWAHARVGDGCGEG